MDQASSIQEKLPALARFQAVLAENQGREPDQGAAQTDFPYLAAFSQEEVNDSSRELLQYTLDAAQSRTTEALEGNLRAWESTASIYNQPATLAKMTADSE